MRKNSNFYIMAFLFVFTAILRFSFAIENNTYFSSDSAHFALAIQDYSIIDDRPHFPGYFLHVYLGKFINLFLGDIHSSLIWLGILYSSLGSIIFYRIALKWLKQYESLLLTLVLISNPFVWFFGSIPEIYSFDLLFSCIIVLAGLSGKWIYFMPLIFAAGTGFRQSSGLLLLPFYFYLWYRYNKEQGIEIKKLILSHLAALTLFLAWFIPMAASAGGVLNYFKIYFENDYAPQFLPLHNLSAMFTYGIYIVIPLLFAGFIYFVNRKKIIKQNDVIDNNNLYQLIIFWMVFPIVFFVLYLCTKGYLMLMAAGIILLLIPFIQNKVISRTYLLVIIALQTCFYLLFPFTQINPEMSFPSRKRNVSKAVIQLNRMSSTMLMANSHIKALESYNRQIDKGIKLLNSKIPGRKFFTLDLSCQVILRAMQPRYPDLFLAEMNYQNAGLYIFAHGKELTIEKGVKDLIKKSIMVGSCRFVNNYLDIGIIRLYEFKDIVFYIVPYAQIDSYIEKINYYYR